MKMYYYKNARWLARVRKHVDVGLVEKSSIIERFYYLKYYIRV